jgi:hypothetical protein
MYSSIHYIYSYFFPMRRYYHERGLSFFDQLGGRVHTDAISFHLRGVVEKALDFSFGK